MHCNHAHSRLVKIIALNTGAEQFACQCVVCGNKATEWIPHRLVKKPEGVVLQSEKPPTISQLLAEQKEQLTELKREAYRIRRTFYDNYLQSPQWQTLRRVVFARCRGLCEACGAAPARQCHHKTYERLGNERADDLMGVCGPCHKKLHDLEEAECI